MKLTSRVVLAAWLGMASLVQAAKENVMSPTEMQALFPEKPDLSAKYIESHFQRMKHTTHVQGEHYFEILFPLDWKPVAQADDISKTGRFQAVMQLRGGDAHVDITIAPVTRDVNASDWAKVGLDEAQEEIVAEREFPENGTGTAGDILSRKSGPEGTLIRRTIAFRVGPDIWLVSARAPEAEFKRKAHDLLFILSTFEVKPISHPGVPADLTNFQPPIEILQRYNADGPVRLSFQYPVSWKVAKGAAKTPDELRLDVTTEYHGANAGSIVIQAWPASGGKRRTEADILNDYDARLKKAGFETKIAPWQIIPTKPPLETMWLVPMTGSFRGSGMNLTTVLMKYKTAWVLIGLVGPSRAASPEWWAITKRAFEVMQQSLKIQ